MAPVLTLFMPTDEQLFVATVASEDLEGGGDPCMTAPDGNGHLARGRFRWSGRPTLVASAAFRLDYWHVGDIDVCYRDGANSSAKTATLQGATESLSETFSRAASSMDTLGGFPGSL